MQQHRREADEAASGIIKEKQKQILGQEESFTIEKPADTLRRRLMLDQNLPYSGGAALSTRDIKPVKKFPDPEYLDPTHAPPATMPSYEGGVLRLSLVDALQVAAYNSREYQTRKESIFTDALALELQRDEFRTSFAAAMSNRTSWDLGAEDPIVGNVTTGDIGLTQRFANGAVASVRLAVDLAKLLTQSRNASLGMAVDGSISIPLLGGGEDVVMEPLTQAERNVAYDLLEFEQYKRQFAVSIASSYYNVLQSFDRVKNQEDNYKRVIRTTRNSRRLTEEGRQSGIQFDQAFQQELSARDSWIASIQTAQRQLDSFKVLLGLPPDAQIELDATELPRLRAEMVRVLKIAPPAAISEKAATQPNARIEGIGATTQPAEIQPTTTKPSTTQAAGEEEVVLVPPSHEGAGPYELPEEQAIRLALENRPDLRVSLGEVVDAQRKVVVAAIALGYGLDLTASGAFGSRRSSPGSATLDDARLRPTKGSYSVGANLDLPLERTAEQNTYRNSLIALERSARAVQQLEDDIKLSIRNQLRTLLQARESLKTQSRAVAVARGRVRSTQMSFDLGRPGTLMRDVLDAQAALVSAENDLTSALVNYRLGELQLQRDLGLLQCDNQGLWREYSPKGEVK